jgi:hypothetical protein
VTGTIAVAAFGMAAAGVVATGVETLSAPAMSDVDCAATESMNVVNNIRRK